MLDRGHQLETGKVVAAVAAADDHGALRVCDLHPERAVGVAGHRAELAGLAEVLALLEFDVVAQPGQVRSGVGEQHAARRQHRSDRLGELPRVQRIGQAQDVTLLPIPTVDRRSARTGPTLPSSAAYRAAHRRPGVGDHGVVCLVRLVDLGRGDVDVDERLVLEQSLVVVERRVLVERVADRQHDVGLLKRLPGARVAAVAEHPDRQRMTLRDDALAVQGGQQRNLEPLDEAA